MKNIAIFICKAGPAPFSIDGCNGVVPIKASLQIWCLDWTRLKDIILSRVVTGSWTLRLFIV